MGTGKTREGRQGESRLLTRIRSTAVASIVAVTITAALGSTTASAGPYEDSPPSFDGLLMLRVAEAYNLTKAYDLGFPARSDEACQIAGVGAQTFVARDHIAWSLTPEGQNLFETSINDARDATGNDGVVWPCYWLRSGSAEASFFPGLHRVWPATLRINFKHLRKAMKRGDCKEIKARMGRYPSPVGTSAKRIRKRVRLVAGGRCSRT